MINKSLELGHYEEDWKVATLRNLAKNRDAELTKSNFGPVSNIPFISKVAEKIVLEQFNEFSSLTCASSSYQLAYTNLNTLMKQLSAILMTYFGLWKERKLQQ